MTTQPLVHVYHGENATRRLNATVALRLSEKALQYRIFEEFIVQVEASAMKPPAAAFDTAPLKAALKALRSNESEETIADANHEIAKWRDALIGRDAEIEAYHIRRYCDGLRTKLPVEVFLAAARFYRDLDFSRKSLSKFDLVMTRAFSTDIGELRRTLIADRDDLADQIALLFADWDETDESPVSTDNIPENVIGRFDEFVEECVATDDFSTLSSSKLFDRIREFKASLGELFFHPQVVSAAVCCNVAVGNRLNFLMSKASENLGERLGADYDLAGAFHDTSPSAGAYLNEVLANIRNEVKITEQSKGGEEVELLRAMFRLASDVRRKPEAAQVEKEGRTEHLPVAVDASQLDPVKFPIASALHSAISDAAAPAGGYYGDCLVAAIQLETSLGQINGKNIKSELVNDLIGEISQIEALASMAEEYLIAAVGSERELLLIVWNRLLQLALRANRIALRSGLATLSLSPEDVNEAAPKIPDTVPPPAILSSPGY